MFGAQQEAIFERLETTKKFGLLSDFHITWSGRRGNLVPRVQVWSNGATANDVVQDYVAKLLRGLVPVHQIAVSE
jgi:hypothetical protein